MRLLGYQQKIVTINLATDQLIIALFLGSTTNCVLQAWRSIDLVSTIYREGILYNPTYIAQAIAQFFNHHHLHNPYVAISISGNAIIEHFLIFSTTEPDQAIINAELPTSCLWDYIYLGPGKEEGFHFYVMGIGREYWWQHYLFVLFARLNSILLTTPMVAHLAFYKQLHKESFRHSQLSIDLEQHNNHLGNYFNRDHFEKTIKIEPNAYVNLDANFSALITNAGLFFGSVSL